MSFEAPELACTVAVEHFTVTGATQKRVVHKNAMLVIGRNEFRDVILKMDLGKKHLKYSLRELTLHKKFAKEGKATIKLPDQRIQFMLSNCPPDQLIMFLKTLDTKLECLKQTGFITERKRLLSELPKTFEEISPLTIKDLQTAHTARGKAAAKAENDMFTPKGKGKRKREPDNDQENRPPKEAKQFKRQISNGTSGSVRAGNPTPLRPVTPIVLSLEQQRVLKAVQQGESIFFTGSAGTGKSFLLRRIIGALPPQHTFATASTGVAACHIGGTTLHSFAGIGGGSGTLEHCIQLASRPLIAQQWKKCKHLIVDEISMIDASFFTKLETVARVIKKNDSPFGGIQLILCGDFLQLPPVTKGNERRKFAFQCSAWQKCVTRNYELTEVRRQSDKHFINILQNIRLGRCPSEVNKTLTATANNNIEKDGILATRLCTHKEDVDQINDIHLKKLNGDSHEFLANDSDPALVKTVNVLCPVREKIILKKGTQVMLTKNLDIQRGLVNGARGVVVGFEKDTLCYPIVKFMCGETSLIRPERWSFKVAGGVILSRRQLPLKLAWAISIHKSQGMSLDCVEMSLSRVFESGQAYVALSRARSLLGLRVIDFEASCVRADPDVVKFYKELRMNSINQQRTLTGMWNN